MRNKSTALVILLALALLVGMALLPGGVCLISDLAMNEKPGTAPIQPVKLALGDDHMDEPGYMLRKLALESRMTTIPIIPDQASMTEEEVYTAALEGMQPYIEANLFSWFQYSFFQAEPYLGIDPMDKNNNTVFWGVTFVNEGVPYRNLFLHIDDETGKILYINYMYDDFYMHDAQTRYYMMEGFADSFFGPLKLTADSLTDYKNLETSAVEQRSTDEAVIVLYTFEDTAYGTVRVELNINPAGFFVHFISE